MHDIGSTQTELPPGPDPELDGAELAGLGEIGTPRSALDALEDPSFELDATNELSSASEDEASLSDGEVEELAYELLGVTSEGELDQFLGKVFKKAWGGIKSAARAAAPHVGRFVKGIAKKALPTVAGALGTFVGGPLGGVIGGKLGAAASNLLEADLEGLSSEEAEVEAARRVVRLAASSARRAARSPARVHPRVAARNAVMGAARLYLPGILAPRLPRRPPGQGNGRRPGGFPGVAGTSSSSTGYAEPGSSGSAPAAGDYQDQGGDNYPPSDEHRGQWVRRGNRIILYGVV